ARRGGFRCVGPARIALDAHPACAAASQFRHALLELQSADGSRRDVVVARTACGDAGSLGFAWGHGDGAATDQFHAPQANRVLAVGGSVAAAAAGAVDSRRMVWEFRGLPDTVAGYG